MYHLVIAGSVPPSRVETLSDAHQVRQLDIMVPAQAYCQGLAERPGEPGLGSTATARPAFWEGVAGQVLNDSD